MTTNTLTVPSALPTQGTSVRSNEIQDARLVGHEKTWVDVCAHDALLPERGVAALVNGAQLALFRTHDGDIHAISNRDPHSGAHVLSRGIVGTRADAPTVASPMYKEVFDLRTGVCLDDPDIAVAVYAVRVRGGRVEVVVT